MFVCSSTQKTFKLAISSSVGLLKSMGFSDTGLWQFNGGSTKYMAGHENKDLLSEAINSFRLFDILKLWDVVHLPWEAVRER
jgi:hypothetical protein